MNHIHKVKTVQFSVIYSCDLYVVSVLHRILLNGEVAPIKTPELYVFNDGINLLRSITDGYQA